MISNFRKSDIAIPSIKPIRDRIFRGREVYLPAVLRYNLVPTSVLIEVANFKNRKDCRATRISSYRQAVAEAYVLALRDYYDSKK